MAAWVASAWMGCTPEGGQIPTDVGIMLDQQIDMPSADMAVDAAPDAVLDAAPDMAPPSTGCAFSTDEVARELVVLHSNDGASRLIGAGERAGIARFVATLRAARAEAQAAGQTVLAVTTGDNTLAGPTFATSLENGPPYFDAVGLAAAGFDAMAVGNHDFDFGPAIFAQFLASFDLAIEAHGEPLTRPVVLAANVDATDEPTLAEVPILPHAVIGGVGVIGIASPDIPRVSSPGAVRVDAPRAAVEAAVQALGDVRPIVLVSHLRDSALEEAIVTEVDGIDVLVAGSSDALLASDSARLHAEDTAEGPYPRLLCGAEGRPVVTVSTGGDYRYLGRLVLALDAAGRVVRVKPESDPIAVVDIAPDPLVVDRVEAPVQAALTAFAENEVASSAVALDGRRAALRAGETNLGDLVADALLWTVEDFVFGTDDPMPDVAILNAGAIRNNGILPPGAVSELDTFAMLPFASFVVQVPAVSRSAFKALLENGVSQVESGSGRFPQVAGVRFEWSASAPARRLGPDGALVHPGARIVSVSLLDGTPIVQDGAVVDGPPLNIATLDFLSRGGDGYPFPAEGQAFGVSYQQALRDFVAGALEGEIGAERYPEGGLDRIRRGE